MESFEKSVRARASFLWKAVRPSVRTNERTNERPKSEERRIRGPIISGISGGIQRPKKRPCVPACAMHFHPLEGVEWRSTGLLDGRLLQNQRPSPPPVLLDPPPSHSSYFYQLRPRATSSLSPSLLSFSCIRPFVRFVPSPAPPSD